MDLRAQGFADKWCIVLAEPHQGDFRSSLSFPSSKKNTSRQPAEVIVWWRVTWQETTNCFVNLRPDFKHPDAIILAFLSNQPKPEHWDSLPVLTTHCLPVCSGAGVRCVAHRRGWWSTELMCSTWCTSSGWWCSHCEHRGNLEQLWPPSQSLEHPLAMLGARECKRGWALIRRCIHSEPED